MNEIRFSVVMIVFNTKEHYLREAISSVLNQKYNNFELIIVDDGSDYNTAKIIDEYSKSALILHQQNGGQTTARINGSKVANGEYVVFVDSDDYISSDTLSTYNQIISEYSVDIVLHDFVKFVGDISNIISHAHYFEKGIVQKKDVLRQICLLHQNGICGRAVKKDLLLDMENVIDFSIRNGEDVQQSVYTTIRANSFYYTDKRLYYYRIIQEHREYYGIDKIDNFNFLTPVYNQLFKSHDCYDEFLPIFKNSAMNSVVYNAFRICLFANSSKQKRELLSKLSSIEINSIINSINEKGSFVSETLYFFFNKKMYFMLNALSRLYDCVFKMQRL